MSSVAELPKAFFHSHPKRVMEFGEWLCGNVVNTNALGTTPGKDAGRGSGK
jgi:hypothetical protein